jgi:hypothetical protein
MLSMGNTFHLSLFRIELSDSCTPPQSSFSCDALAVFSPEHYVIQQLTIAGHDKKDLVNNTTRQTKVQILHRKSKYIKAFQGLGSGG